MRKIIFTLVVLLFTIFTFAQCPAGQTEVTIDVGTDNWGEEIYWELAPSGSTCGSLATIFSGGNSVVGCNSNSATSGGYPDNITIHELFEKQVLITPQSYAVVDNDNKLSFNEFIIPIIEAK